jgi:hypothetical protein
MSKQNGATIYYIVPGSPIVQSIVIYDYELKVGTTYEYEAQWKMPNNVQHYRVILFEQAGSPSAIADVNWLRDIAKKSSLPL